MRKPKNPVTTKWGMVTRHQKPFGDGVNEITAKQFDKAHTELIDRHIRETFKGYWGGGNRLFKICRQQLAKLLRFLECETSSQIRNDITN